MIGTNIKVNGVVIPRVTSCETLPSTDPNDKPVSRVEYVATYPDGEVVCVEGRVLMNVIHGTVTEA